MKLYFKEYFKFKNTSISRTVQVQEHFNFKNTLISKTL